MFVPKHVEDAAFKDTILQQNNLSHKEDPVLNIKFTKRTFEDSRHMVIEVSPNLRRELVALRKIKLYWSMCKVQDFVVVTRCLKCLGFGHTSRFCQNQQKCSRCAKDHRWKECGNQHPTRCSNFLKANTYIHDDSKKINTNHSVFSKECPRMRRIESIIMSKTDYSYPLIHAQINTDHCRAAMEHLSLYKIENKVDILFIQEQYCYNGEPCYIPSAYLAFYVSSSTSQSFPAY